jgi:gas vesicle protein
MTNDSKLPTTGPSLVDRLKAKTAEQAGAIQALTQSELQQHRKNLTDLSQHALSTTRDVIDSQVSQIKQALSGTAQQVTDAMTAPEQQIIAALNQGAEQIRALNKTLDSTNSTLKKSLEQTTAVIKTQQSDLTAEVQDQTRRLLWMLKIPVLATVAAVLAVCLTVCAATWGWTIYRLDQLQQIEAQAAQRLAQTQQTINQLTEQFCATPAGLKACQTLK